MPYRFAVVLTAFSVTACTSVFLSEDPKTPLTTLPFFGDGYPAPGDPCRRLGENAETVNYLDHTADLIACPETWQGLNDFTVKTRALEITRLEGFVVLSVPNGT